MADYNNMTYEQAEDVLNDTLHVAAQDEMGGHAVYLASVALEKQIPEETKRGEKMTEWIPVTERLPEEGTEIIVNFATQNKKAMTGSAIYKYGTWWYMGLELTPDAVDAWMPFPEPYYPESEAENG